MQLIKHPGYILDKKAIDKILKSSKTKEYLKAMAALNEKADNMDAVEYACSLNEDMTPESLAVIEVECGDNPGMKHSGYINARTYEWLFEVCYLISVLGDAPYPEANELGLDDEDIKSYQEDWRKIGIEPLLVKTC